MGAAHKPMSDVCDMLYMQWNCWRICRSSSCQEISVVRRLVTIVRKNGMRCIGQQNLSLIFTMDSWISYLDASASWKVTACFGIVIARSRGQPSRGGTFCMKMVTSAITRPNFLISERFINVFSSMAHIQSSNWTRYSLSPTGRSIS